MDVQRTCSSDDDDDVPALPLDTLAILQEFYQEQAERQGFTLEANGGKITQGEIDVEEDWNLSQFWYDDQTATILAKECLRATNNGRIACVSSPTLYRKLLEFCSPEEATQIVLLEYDKRFSMYGSNFIFYDYNDPLSLPETLKEHSFDLVMADPPFLNEECLAKTSETIKYLTKDKIILCTGAVMEDAASKLLNLRLSKFIPGHARNLANEFRCYVNFETELDKIGDKQDS